MQQNQHDSDQGPDLPAFALGIYKADGVPAACLLLQERADLDVNLVLCAAYIGVQRRTLSDEHLAELSHRIGAWHREVVRPLRGIRTRLKSGPPPAPDKRTAALRAAIQKLEIEAEVIELAELGQVTATLQTESAYDDETTCAAAAIEVVVRAKIPRDLDVDENAAISCIAGAAVAFVDEIA